MWPVRRVLAISVLMSYLISNTALAGPPGWYWGMGYHNPPNAAIGLNFTRLWYRWAFEFGMGYLNSTESEDCTPGSNGSIRCYFSNASSSHANLDMAGAINVKYILGQANIRPYIQVGSFAGLAVQSGPHLKLSGALGSSYSGLGFFIMGDTFDFYLSYLFAGPGLLQFGFNF